MHEQQSKPGVLAKGNPVKVEVRAYLNPVSHQVKFEETWESDWGKGSGNNQPINFPSTSQANIHFHLNDETKLDLKFLPYNPPRQPPTKPKDYPIYVGTGPACPPAAGLQGDQISILSSSPNLLKVFNNNTSKCDLIYALRFSGDDNIAGNEYAPYVDDPEIKNGGGGVPFQNAGANYFALILGAAALAAIGYVVYEVFFD